MFHDRSTCVSWPTSERCWPDPSELQSPAVLSDDGSPFDHLTNEVLSESKWTTWNVARCRASHGGT